MLDIRIDSELVTKHPSLTKDQIEAFQGPTVTIYDIFTDRKFHIDFILPPKAAFNKAARVEFIRHFLAAIKQNWYSNPAVAAHYLQAYYIGLALDRYVDTLRRKYRVIQNPPKPTALEQRADAACKNSRRGTVRCQFPKYPDASFEHRTSSWIIGSKSATGVNGHNSISSLNACSHAT